MSTQIQITPKSGITIGSTAITSGTDTRVLFQSGGVVSQDSNFTYDSTLKRLVLKAVGTASTDIPLRIRNSSDTDNLAYISGNGLAVIGINSSSSPTLIIDPSGSARATLRGGSNQSILLNSSGWNNLNGGSGGWDIEATGGEIRQRNGSNYTLLTGNYFGIGRTPTARLDVQAQGALSTDLALRVRNSANNENIFTVRGDHSISLLHETEGINFTRPTAGSVKMRHYAVANLPSTFTIQSEGAGGSVGQIRLDAFDGNTPALTVQRLISGLSDLTGSTLYTGFGTNAATFVMKNALNYGGYGVNPTGTAADHFAMYSADIVAGNAAPHFRTEAGNIIKLFTGAALTTPDGTLSNAVARIAELEARLQANGLIL